MGGFPGTCSTCDHQFEHMDLVGSCEVMCSDPSSSDVRPMTISTFSVLETERISMWSGKMVTGPTAGIFARCASDVEQPSGDFIADMPNGGAIVFKDRCREDWLGV
eukprot:CAMPEP_0194537284 /NCGR_PEP_ID=MMETSP0253-20130528/76509_1 /TAXON_ID=2966 /ORGANISM="Noctiluca scintillans" /LENGTH=105 /DNA_ID=CAMNT_0039383283 /DNA_START=62 /DNA_END=379 /DNA_ORIENTATION=+